VNLSSVPVRLAAFAGALALAFGAAFAVGGSVDPVVARTDSGAGRPAATHPEGHGAAATTASLPGLTVTDRGYTLRPAAETSPAGTAVPFRFTVTGPDGSAVTRYTESHDKQLHLIVVRRDLAGFQHVHPTRDAAGTWTVPLDLRTAGTYRVLADFAPTALGGDTLTLGTDLAVGGRYTPAPLPAPAAVATVDGYEVRLAGHPEPGREAELTFTVREDGRPVGDLEPYLGAFGHLVSLRAGDLAYLHTHPAEEAATGQQGGPQVRFGTTFPTEGTYRLFLDFRHAGEVRTAEFTVHVGHTPMDAADHTREEGHS
jgi:hypothetical protein